MPKVRPARHVPGEAPFALDAFLSFRIVVLAESITRAFADVYEQQFGLTVFEGRVIAVVGANGEQTTRQIIERTRLDRVRVSRAVIRLSDKNLITRFNTPNDQRAQILNLTPAGRAIYRQLVPLAQKIQAIFAASLSDEERRRLDSILDKLSAGARRLGNNQLEGS